MAAWAIGVAVLAMPIAKGQCQQIGTNWHAGTFLLAQTTMNPLGYGWPVYGAGTYRYRYIPVYVLLMFLHMFCYMFCLFF